MPRTLRRLVVGACALAALSALPATAGAAAPPGPSAGGGPLPFFDVRSGAIARAGAAPAAAPRTLDRGDRAARRRLVRGLGRQALLDPDPITATPRALGRLNGTLTRARSGAAAAVALRYVRAHADALGIDARDLASLRLTSRSTIGGITHLRWRQEYRGIPAYDNELRVNVDGDGRVINVLGAPRHGLSVRSVRPRLSAAAAMRAVVRDVGGTAPPRVTRRLGGVRAATRFSSGDRARLVLFGDVRTVRLAWHLTYDAGPDALYDAVVDARTGRVLRRANLVSPVAVSVFDNFPGARAGGAQRTVDLAAPHLTDTTRLLGDFAHAWSDVNDAVPPGAITEQPDPNEEVAPGAYPFSDFTAAVGDVGACAPTAKCSWDHVTPGSWEANRRQNAVQVFYYVNHFHDHLAAPPINFTAASGNFEGADLVNVETDDGADTAQGLPNGPHQNNANMAVPPDGRSPTMQMYLFQHDPTITPAGFIASAFRDVNGGDDASVVYHEYTHGLSMRLVVNADGTGAVNSPQSKAMGEGWSDWYAKDLLNREGFQPDDPAVAGEVDMGAYTDSPRNRIRTQPLDCPVGSGPPACPGPTPPSVGTAGAGGYTLGDYGKIYRRGGPEVHADGEIWGETLWDLRTALGSAVTEAIITEGMRLSPPEPSFLDARNAILQADQALFGGAHVNGPNGIWAVFARRGMGFFAGTEDASDAAPVEDFRTPAATGAPTGTITGRAFDPAGGQPIAGVVVGVGGLATPPSSFAATTGADGRFTIGPVPAGTYPVVMFRPTAGFDRFAARAVTVPAGGSATVDAPMRRDWAAISGGAGVAATNDDVFAGSGCGPAAALDLSLGVGWSAYTASTTGPAGFPPNPHPGAPPSVTVELPQAVDVTALGVDPSNTCGDDRTAATKDLRVEVSTDGTTFTTAIEHTFGASDLGRLNVLPLPAARSGVRFVRVSLLSNLGPAAPGDPPGGGQHFVDLTELEVFGTPAAAAATLNPASAPAAVAPAPPPASAGRAVAAVRLGSRPTARVAGSPVRGRAVVTVGCSAACRATASVVLSGAAARRLGLPATRLARATARLAGPAHRTLAVTITRRTVERLRRRGVRTVTATVAVSVRDGRGRTRTVRRAVRIRVR